MEKYTYRLAEYDGKFEIHKQRHIPPSGSTTGLRGPWEFVKAINMSLACTSGKSASDVFDDLIRGIEKLSQNPIIHKTSKPISVRSS